MELRILVRMPESRNSSWSGVLVRWRQWGSVMDTVLQWREGPQDEWKDVPRVNPYLKEEKKA